MIKTIGWLLTLFLLTLPGHILADIKIIHAEHEYVMGDNDTKTDARRFCFIEAKRKVLDKAGVWIESRTNIKNHQLIKDEIKTYSAALLKAHIVDEKWRLSGNNMIIWLRVKAEVDTDYINKKLSEINQNAILQKRIKDQQNQLNQLEKRLMSLQRKIDGAGKKRVSQLRKERESVYQRIRDIEASSMEKFWRK